MIKLTIRNILWTITFVVCGYSVAEARTHVRGYERRDGTYVDPYYRTNPDHTKRNNYTTKGNINPYTGKEGTKEIDKDSEDTFGFNSFDNEDE